MHDRVRFTTGTVFQYRPEIDGLRAIAIVTVMLFHSDLGLLKGGFVGVDVFFVISGCLITNVLLSDARRDRLTLRNFYERRVKRILPCLTVVVLATALASYALLLPQQLVELGSSILATSVFASNFWFWQHSDYFDAPSAMMPLLHTWSLAIEEQFYVGYPILFLALHRRRTWLVVTIAAIATLSFLCCSWLTPRSPPAAFYLIPTRAWELMVGCLLAFASPPKSGVVRQFFSGAGILLIAGASLLLDQTIPYPGAYAAIPVTGAAMIIAGGDGTAGGRLLSTPVARWCGKLSYSLYLWHWPILVLAKQFYLRTGLPAPVTAACLIATVLASWLTWRFVEEPARGARLPQKRVFACAAAALVTSLAVGYIPILRDGFPERFSPENLRYAQTKMSPGGRACLDLNTRITEFCRIGEGAPSFILWGDSHAGALMSAMEHVARLEGRSGILFAYYGCPPVPVPPQEKSQSHRSRCMAKNETVLRMLQENPSISTLILAAYWSSYALTPRDLQMLSDRLPGRRIIVLGDVPTPGFNVPWVLALGGPEAHAAQISPSRADPGQGLAPQPDLVSIPLDPALCKGEACPIQIGGQSLYADTDHISEFASRAIVGPYLLRVLRNHWADREPLP